MGELLFGEVAFSLGLLTDPPTFLLAFESVASLVTSVVITFEDSKGFFDDLLSIGG